MTATEISAPTCTNVRVDLGRRAEAARGVPNTMALFDTHFPRYPILPGVLVLQFAADVAALAVPDAPDGTRPVRATRVRWRQPVRPGDLMTVSAELLHDDGVVADFRARVEVDGVAVADIQHLTIARRSPLASSPEVVR